LAEMIIDQQPEQWWSCSLAFLQTGVHLESIFFFENPEQKPEFNFISELVVFEVYSNSTARAPAEHELNKMQ